MKPEDYQDTEAFVDSVLSEKFTATTGRITYDEIVGLLTTKITSLPSQGVKIISLIGAPASGKSTLTDSIISALADLGITADYISSDDFNLGDRAWRWENFEGDNPQDQIGKYDFSLMRSKVDEIKQNSDPSKTVAVPTYDPITGLAVEAGEDNYTHKISAVDVLIVEGDFHPIKDSDLTVFVHLEDEARLQSRIDRDMAKRAGGDPEKVTKSFNFRQRSQLIPYTLPVMQVADVVVRTDLSDPKARKYIVYDHTLLPA